MKVPYFFAAAAGFFLYMEWYPVAVAVSLCCIVSAIEHLPRIFLEMFSDEENETYGAVYPDFEEEEKDDEQ